MFVKTDTFVLVFTGKEPLPWLRRDKGLLWWARRLRRFEVVETARKRLGYVAEPREVEWAGALLPPSRASEVGLGSDLVSTHLAPVCERRTQLPLAFKAVALQRPSRRDEQRQQPRHDGPPARLATAGHGRTHRHKGHAHFGPFWPNRVDGNVYVHYD